MKASNTSSDSRTINSAVWSYLALAFGLSWAMTILAIKLNASEAFLNFGTAGPAFAAMILSARRNAGFASGGAVRWFWFAVFLLAGWGVLSLHYLWQTNGALTFHLEPLYILPAVFPAWILSGFLSKDDGIRDLIGRLVHRPTRWGVYALLVLPVLLLILSAVAHQFGSQLTSPAGGKPPSFALANGLMFLLFNVLFVATLEEPGWRGFLLDNLQRRFSPLAASMLVWLPWALWHAPLDYYRPTPWTLTQYILLRGVTLIPLTIILTWFYNRSNRSIQTTALFHASMNTTPFVLPYFPPAWALIFVWAGYAVIKDRMWRRA